jgi:hypothetical protein
MELLMKCCSCCEKKAKKAKKAMTPKSWKGKSVDIELAKTAYKNAKRSSNH